MVHIGNDWDFLLKEEFTKEYYQNLRAFLTEQYSRYTIYPEKKDIFNALKYTSYQNAKVVILGQDPYHGKGQAHGLCFSVQKGVKVPPSLKNIYKELQDDLGCRIPTHGELSKWAKQGVLMLNATLTVKEATPNSHAKKGWETFTNEIISLMNEKKEPVVFILWGKNAQEKKELITNSYHFILSSAHPSPLSAYNGFWGCHHFSKTNTFLKSHHLEEIDWQIDE